MAEKRSIEMASGDAEPEPKRRRVDYRSFIKVLVGSERTEYPMPEDLICSRSPFFAAAVRDKRARRAPLSVWIPDATMKIFNTYADWAYTSNLDTTQLPQEKSDASYKDLAKLWVFANYILDVELCNVVANAIVKKYHTEHNFPSVGTMHHVWENTVATSPLRTLFIDVYAAHKDCQKFFDKDEESLPQEFMAALARKFLARSRFDELPSVSDKRGICRKYHMHKDDDGLCKELSCVSCGKRH